MSLIPQDFIDDLLDRTDIVEVIDSRVKLRKAGKNYLACCPFHKEKTPSFSVSPDKQFYYCFGCGASGTAITFLLQYEHLGFLDAVDSLARSVGMQVPRVQSDKPQKSNKSLYTLLEKAAAYYQAQLKEHPKRNEPVQYLKDRGLNGAICKEYGLGFAPPGWDNLQVKLGLTEEDRRLLQDAGMTIVNEETRSTYDRFRNRIMFPILDVRGRTIGFGGRILNTTEKGPKYLNSPETPIFHKGQELYGLYQARQQAGQIAHLLVVEGYMDVIALAQFGILNAVATLGTACGEDHLKLAFRYTQQVVFCFDGDNAGRKAARRALENSLPVMSDGRQVKFLFLPEGQDPDSLVRQIGPERFTAQIDSAMPLEEFFFDAVAEGLDIRTMEGRASMSKRAAPLLHKLPAGVYRELMFDFLAKRTGLGLDVLRELVDEPIAVVADDEHTNDEVEPPPVFAPLPSLAPLTQHRPAAAFYFSPASKTTLSPIKTATAILLEFPQLAAELEGWESPAIDDVELKRFNQLLAYLQSRPQASFHSILGYWGGRYGMEEQKQLAALVANQFLGAVKRSAPFDVSKELKDACWRIQRQIEVQQHEQELKVLASLAELSAEQKQRMKELLLLKTKARQAPQ